VVNNIEITSSFRACSFLIFSPCPVALVRRQSAVEAILNRRAAVLNAPNPDRLILMATEFAPKAVHRNLVKTAAKKIEFLGLGFVCHH